ncbi:MAG: cytochrome d ubiquinol oxidase subunit II [Nitrospira sp. CR1.3]|nr:cytochrome d ubiquinol oxidase subunit II [Nitrospira sp. CR1.3]
MMETIWYAIVTLMLAIFVALDGFDFGVGIVYPFVTRSETDRRMALMSIGPVWNGNEVWLIAGGGLLFFAFPKVYAAGFSGFYLALILVLWLLIFRGLALELRSHLDHPIWTRWWDGAFSGASFLLAVVFGAALGNLIRGVPLNHDGYFFVALWTDFQPGPEPGILDWFTVLMGLTSASILALHGANYLAMKTEGDLYRRVDLAGRFAGWSAAGLTILALLAVPVVQPSLRLNFAGHPLEYLLPLTGSLMLGATLYFRSRQRDMAAFLASSLFILTMLASVACGMYPHLLMSSTNPALSLTAFNAATDSYGLAAGLAWFVVGFFLLLAYQICAHRAFRGKVRLDAN